MFSKPSFENETAASTGEASWASLTDGLPSLVAGDPGRKKRLRESHQNTAVFGVLEVMRFRAERDIPFSNSQLPREGIRGEGRGKGQVIL